MDTQALIRHFESIGATLRISFWAWRFWIELARRARTEGAVALFISSIRFAEPPQFTLNTLTTVPPT